ncbi:fizzy-related protein homolog [Planococcus citri]|uniref:fizzy-related protein homolog n=1 Tax=Planococcus citri TaxID=170843 RepID=UPI0031F9338E
MDEELSVDSLYIQRLLWQQKNCPQYVVLPSSTKDALASATAGQDGGDVKMESEDCYSKSFPVGGGSEYYYEDLENNNGRYTVKEPEFKFHDKNAAAGKENDMFTLLGNENKFSPKSENVADRFIPKRDFENWQTRFSMINESNIPGTSSKKKESVSGDGNRDALAYNYLLQNELLGASFDGIAKNHCDERKNDGLQTQKNLFHYRRKTDFLENIESTSPYSLSPVSPKSQKLLRSPRKATRKISRIPFKVLDAPELQDDFYLNLVDWSSQNVLAVGLGNSVYLWSACTSQVTRLCDFLNDNNTVTSVAWNDRGNYVAVGTHHGYVQIWDVAVSKLVCKLTGHSARVGALAWNGESLSSGSRDRMILQRDIRSPPNSSDKKLAGHRQEVCGLKWSPDNQYLASGGNDNRLYVWNLSSTTPIQTYTDHLAAVKAIAWSPHQHGLLASGGGTADRCIRFWNTLTGQAMQCVDTGSQVCNLAWSKHSSELVSTHGYSQNQILVWKYPTLTQVAKLTGHSYRVLYLAMSPDGESIVTGAGDETLRFWNVFSKARSQKECRGKLNLFSHIR